MNEKEETSHRKTKGGEAFEIDMAPVGRRVRPLPKNSVPQPPKKGMNSSCCRSVAEDPDVESKAAAPMTSSSTTSTTTGCRSTACTANPLTETPPLPAAYDAGEDSDAGGSENGAAADSESWRYSPPPNNQRTMPFPEDGLTFDSRFDSGNLHNVERVGRFQYILHLANDCMGAPWQTGNKQWFHFSIAGGVKGTTVSLTLSSIPSCRMYTYSYCPVVACVPNRTQYTRMVGRVTMNKVDPPTSTASGDAIEPLTAPTNKNPAKKANYINMNFEYTFEYDGNETTVYFANAHPYPYSKLQRHIMLWKKAAHESQENDRIVLKPHSGGIFFHHEILIRSLDGYNIDLLTVTGMNGRHRYEREPMLEAGENPIPLTGPENRPPLYPSKPVAVISARVHPGETPSSHILHGLMELLMNRNDPRAQALRDHFVFMFVPMINPDGVVRGHSRADPLGQNLNRMYKDPSRQRQPSTYALRKLLFNLAQSNRLALYVDLHAHANKKGAFFFGNAMDALQQIQNLLYAKLVALNSPYLEFPSCNFSEQNMYAIGANGVGKDSSIRVTLFRETGFVHCYTLESNYVTGNMQNAIAPLPSIPGEDVEVIGGTPSPKFSPATFADIGRALGVSLLDLRGLNPLSRLGSTSFHNLRGVALWIQRALVVDAWEQQRKIQALRSGTTLTNIPENPPAAPTQSALAELPLSITTRPSRHFPPVTTFNLASIAKADKESSSGSGAPRGKGSSSAPSSKTGKSLQKVQSAVALPKPRGPAANAARYPRKTSMPLSGGLEIGKGEVQKKATMQNAPAAFAPSSMTWASRPKKA